MITMCFRIVMNILDCTIATKPTSSRMPVARTLRTPKPSAMPVPAPSPRGVSTPSWPLQRLSTPRSTRTSPTIPLRQPLPLSLPSTPWCCSARRPVPRSRSSRNSNRRAHPTVAPGMLRAINGLRTAQLFATTATRPATRLRFARAAAVLRAALLPIFYMSSRTPFSSYPSRTPFSSHPSRTPSSSYPSRTPFSSHPSRTPPSSQQSYPRPVPANVPVSRTRSSRPPRASSVSSPPPPVSQPVPPSVGVVTSTSPDVPPASWSPCPSSPICHLTLCWARICFTA